MSHVYQCSKCQPACFLVADDDDMPTHCPYFRKYPGSPTIDLAEWRQIQ